MGRKRIKIAYIQSNSKRKSTGVKRTIGVIKKARELSILCDKVIQLVIDGELVYDSTTAPEEFIEEEQDSLFGSDSSEIDEFEAKPDPKLQLPKPGNRKQLLLKPKLEPVELPGHRKQLLFKPKLEPVEVPLDNLFNFDDWQELDYDTMTSILQNSDFGF